MTTPFFKKIGYLLVLGALATWSSSAFGDSGTWAADSDGNWSDTAKWTGGVVADGDGNTANFNAVDLTANRTVTLDSARTLSALIFGDTAAPGFNWTLTGANVLTLGSAPLLNVSNQTATIALPLTGTAGLTKTGNGTLTFLGTNNFTGTSAAVLVSNGVVNFNGASKSSGVKTFSVGGANGRAVVNINTTGSITNNSASGTFYGVGGLQPDTTDTGVGVLNLIAGTLNNGNNNDYTEIGTGSQFGNTLTNPVSYGCFNLQGGTFNTLGSSGIRVGAGGLGIFNQTGGTLNCSRWFAVGSQPQNGGNVAGAGGYGVVNFLGGTATIASGNRIILNDKNGSIGILNLGTAAGGSATVSALNTSTTQGGIDFLDQGGDNARAILNLNNGTLRLAGPMYRNNATGQAQINWNGATLQLNANNMNLATTANNFPAVNVYNRGVVIDTLGNTVSSAIPFLQPAGNGLYPAGGTLAVTSGGGSGYLGAPVVTISGGSGSNAMAIANLSSGAVTGVTLTCPGQNYQAGDVLTFTFTGGGATTPASAFNYTLQAADLAANTRGGLAKFGSGKLTLTAASTYTGDTVVGAGTLDVTVDGGMGYGNVNVSSGATLILEGGATNGYIAATANLVVSSGGVVNLNYGGEDVINGLSLDGGATYVSPGTYGPSGSGAANVDDTHFTGFGILNVTATPAVTLTVVLTSSANPSVYGQSVNLTATVTSTGGGTPTGTVTFKDGTAEIGTVELNGSGVAVLTTNGLAVGSHPLTAVYNGTTSQILVQTVNIPTDVWSGAVSGVWDINNALNWTVAGSPAKYQEGNYAQLDDSATGSTAITLDVNVNPASLLISNAAKAYAISGAGGIAGATGLTKTGAGSLTLNVANAYTGLTVVSNGVVTYAANSSNSGNGSLQVGGDTGAVLNVNTTNTVSFNGSLSVGGNIGDSSDGNIGAINQTSGTFSSGGGGNAYIEIGAGGYGVYGAYNLFGGTLNTFNTSGVRVGATGTGVYVQSGGFLNCSRYFAVGTQSGVNNLGGYGLATFTGGSALFSSAYRVIIGDKPGATGILNLGTEAGGTATLTNLYNNGGNGGFELVDNNAATSGTLNLNSGILQVGGAIWRPVASAGSAALNLNGATLQAGANNISLITNVNSGLTGDFVGNVFSRGIVVDSLANNCSIDADLIAMGGNGIYPATGRLPVTDGGSGYIGAPVVTVVGGSGYGAMAVASVSNGVVTGVEMTCPGQYYQAGDVVFFDFGNGGGAVVPAGLLTYTLQANDVRDNALGGLTKIGSGQLTLTTLNNSYTGATVVSNGTLVVAGSLSGGGAVNVNGGRLGGTGSIYGPVTVKAGGTLTAGISDVGTLTIYNNLTFQPGATFSAKINKGAATQDLVQGVSQLTYAGTLVVTNLSGTLAVGDSFKLFDAASYSGAFTSIVPATPGSGLAWDLTQLTNNGTLNIVVGSAVNPNPTNIVVSVTGNAMNLSWPADHTGWQLQVQTNSLSTGLSTNWVNVADSTTTNKVTVPLVPANGSVFYRLVLPNP
jgi:autotransporter-associated beta strand protein